MKRNNRFLKRYSRRRFLRWVGSGSLVGLAGCGGGESTVTLSTQETPTAATTQTPIPSPPPSPTEVEPPRSIYFPGNIDYWAWFPSDQDLWSRSKEPYDFRTSNRRWHAWLTGNRGVRCRVEGDEPPGNAGFYLDVGAVGGVERLSIEHETVHSDRDGEQRLLVALYFDVTNDGRYFEWETEADREAFAGLAGDSEAIATVPGNGTITVTADTEFTYITSAEQTTTTLKEIQAGDVEGVSAGTQAALQVSVVGSGRRNVEEGIVHQVKVEPKPAFTAEDWPMFSHDRLNTGTTTVTSGPSESVSLQWSVETGDAVRSSPAVVDGTVYVGSDDGQLYALDAQTGRIEWTLETRGPIESSPAVYRYLVFVGSHDNHVYGIDVTGEVQWSFETGGRVRMPPKVSGNMPGEGDVVAVGSVDGKIYFLDPWTGEELDAYYTGAPIVAPPMLYVNRHDAWEADGGNTAGIEYGYFPESGSANRNDRWAPIYAAISAPKDSPERDVWYIANDDGRLDRWEHPPPPWPDPKWTFRANDKIRTTPVLSSPHVFVGSWDGTLYALEETAGEIDWSIETDGKIDSSPAVAGDTIYFGSGDGSVYGVDITTGEVRWTYETGGEIHSSPAVFDGTVYIGSNDGQVYALGS